MIKYSIVIPTYNNCNKYLVPCINSIFDYTDTSNIEVIISANGCTDNTKEYLNLLQQQHPGKFKIAWSDEPLGYPKATNAGIRLATADKIILLNNDIVFLPQEKNTWINILEQPFLTNPKCGVVGDIKIFSEAANHDFAIFFCVMIKREVFDKIGLLNEEYGIGMGEDIEFCIEAEKAGYDVIEPLPKQYLHEKGIWTNDFPIQHFAEGTMHDTDLVKDYSTHYSKNLLLLAKKYNPIWYMQRNPIEYSIIIPTYNHCNSLLKPCLNSIFEYTDTTNLEIIIVANGCTDNTKEYLESLSNKVKTIWYDEPIGYPKAINAGIKASSGNYVILLNNDVLLFPQEKNTWINMLRHPFEDSNTGITGPVKFNWKCGVNTHEAMAFWLVMIRRDLFNKIGLLDEVFSPGMGEDGDFCIKTVQAGYKLVSVPDNVSGEFDTGIINTGFPIYHTGNGTFGDDHNYKNNVIERNNQILQTRYGKNVKTSIIIPTYNHLEDALKPCIESVLKYTSLDDKEIIVVANGCTDGTKEYLDNLADKLFYIWFDRPTGVVKAYNAGIDAAKGQYIITFDNDSYLLPQRQDEWIDILMKPFVEDDKVGGTSPFANYYEDIGLLLHSGCTMYRTDVIHEIGKFDEAYNPGYFCDPDVAAKIWEHGYKCVAVPEYHNDNYVNNVFVINFPVVHEGYVQTMDKNKDIEIVKINRKLLYKQHGKKNVTKYSIIIPTYNHCDDLLKPCIESIKKYTDLSNVEVIVIANGCVDNTREYVEQLSHPFKLIWSDEPLGYTKATNLGIKAAVGEYIVLLNNDTELLPQSTNQWLTMMEEKFTNSVGMVGPLMLHDNYSNHDVLIFFCVMVKREVFNKIGLLDEIYSPGGGEDIDFSVRMKNAGYEIAAVSDVKYMSDISTNSGPVPIWHKDNKTFGEIPIYTNEIVKTNGLLNCKRYNKNIKLNLGAGGVDYPGYLSVDLYDKRAHIHMDITKLNFDDNTVEEILASHVFEHLNPYHSIDILKNWLRVLKPGGKLIMEMPNIEELCKRFVTASTGERYGILNAIYGSVNTTNEGGPDNITSPHLFGWWPQSIIDHLTNAGFTNIQIMNEQIPHPESNFRVEAYKPEKVNLEWLKTDEESVELYQGIVDQNEYRVNEELLHDKIVVDVGANRGIFSVLAASLGARRVVSYEPVSNTFNTLLDNILKSGFNNIKPIQKIVSNETGNTVRISLHESSGHNGLYNPSIKDGQQLFEEVETISLHDAIKNFTENVFLKLDCEGSEYDIILSMTEQDAAKIDTIVLEIHEELHPTYRGSEVLYAKLKELGYNQLFSNQTGWWTFNEKGERTTFDPLPFRIEMWKRS